MPFSHTWWAVQLICYEYFLSNGKCCYTMCTLSVLYCSKCSKIGWALRLIRSPLSTATSITCEYFARSLLWSELFPFFLLGRPCFGPNYTAACSAGRVVMKTLILNNFFSAPTFCSLLTGLVRLAHLVLDQGLWGREGGGERNGNEGRVLYMIWEGWKIVKRLWPILECVLLFPQKKIIENKIRTFLSMQLCLAWQGCTQSWETNRGKGSKRRSRRLQIMQPKQQLRLRAQSAPVLLLLLPCLLLTIDNTQYSPLVHQHLILENLPTTSITEVLP